MAKTKDITIAPLTGVFDLRSRPATMPPNSVRMRQNLQTVAEGKLRRGVGWSKLLTKSGYNNSDFHDQLLGFDGIAVEDEVVSVPAPFAYYKLDTFVGGTNVPDSIAGLDLIQTFGADPAIVAAKIGNGYDFDAIATGIFRVTDASADIGGVDCTIRFWAFQETASNGLFNLLIVNGGSNTSYFQLNADNDGGFDNKAIATIRTNVGGGATPIEVELPSNQWNHIMAWHETGVEIGIRVNNGTPVTLPFTTGVDVTSRIQLRFDGPTGTTDIIDEIAIWKGQALTEAEQTADWNEGNGQTWPWI